MAYISDLKIILDIPPEDLSRDCVLDFLLESARSYILSYCRIDELDGVLASCAVSMAAEDYGTLGGEGLDSRTVSGIAEHYRPRYSEKILDVLKRYRRPGVLRG